ncbi:FtsX-like permease family protein [Saccharicrinis sp. 156]|uniref:FtsX-like permease family protein n=1 Tax=Saccharicrinis sp. 156 TaxID=3417574 RepID=UPI003D33743C
MKTSELIKKNIRFFARYFKLVGLAVLISTAVIAGSLIIGDSVRSSLVNQVTERLGNTETVIFAHNAYLEEAFTEEPLFESSARGVLLSNGFISLNGALLPVMVWGVNDLNINKGQALINTALSNELNLQKNESLVLRLPAPGLVPSGSLFVTETYTTSLRLEFKGTLDVSSGGNLSLLNEQRLPLNIFVNRHELAETMEVPGKVNLILSDKIIGSDELNKAWHHELSGLSVQQKEGFTELRSDRIFLQYEILETLGRTNPGLNRMYSYLGNSIYSESGSIPYSFVTAMDEYKGEKLLTQEVILSDYSAKRLKVKVGDEIWISFYTSQDFKTLVTDSLRLRVKNIVPLTRLVADTALSANFPGISDVESCTAWDSDLPIDMDLITEEDEHYWELYHSAPKAILSYKAVADLWGNTYGHATGVRITGGAPDLSGLKASMFGVQIVHPRESGIYAAKNGVDFAGLFMALGFFIILGAILLMIVPMTEMIHKRKYELELLKALGYTVKRIRYLLWMESAPMVMLSAMAGVITGLLYTSLIIWLLNSFWQGATHTSSLSVYSNVFTLAMAFFIGIVLSLFILHLVISRHVRDKESQGRGLGRPRVDMRFSKKLASLIIAGILTLSIAVYNLFFVSSVALFAITGILLLLTFALWGHNIICKKGNATENAFRQNKMIWRALFANKNQAVLSYLSLAIGVFIVFSVGLNRQDFNNPSKLTQATGGYDLWCECAIPVYHNMNTEEGKEKLNLLSLSGEPEILQCLRYKADEASCLNLNKVITPTVLGVDMRQLFESEIGLTNNIYEADRQELLKQLQEVNEGVYPVLVDATVLQWSLVKNLGDTIYYTGSNGQEVAVQLVGTLPNTIFQGHVLMDKKVFSEIWPDITGSEVFLLNTEPDAVDRTKTFLSQAMYEYGVRVNTTNARLAQFNTVTDTYLTIFMTLGGIGLLIGIMGFVIVIRKNLGVRQYEIEMYARLGFSIHKTKQILYRENIPVPLYAIVTGLISAIISIGSNYTNVGLSVWIMALILTGLFMLLTLTYIKRVVQREVQRNYK